MATIQNNLGATYNSRAIEAQDINDMDQCVVDLDLALFHVRDAARIFRAINHVDMADKTAQAADDVEECLRDIVTKRAAATRG